MTRELAVLLVGLIVGGLVTAALVRVILPAWWQLHDRRQLVARMQAMEDRIERLRIADATDARSLDALFALPSMEPRR